MPADRTAVAACGAKRCQGHVLNLNGPIPLALLEALAEDEDERPSEADISRAVEIPRVRGDAHDEGTHEQTEGAS